MHEINVFLANNYIYFAIGSGILFLILILYIIFSKRPKKHKKNEALETIKVDENIFNNPAGMVSNISSSEQQGNNTNIYPHL